MKKFAAFDIDGTLIRWQLYHAIANNFAKKGYFGEGGAEELRNLRMKWKNREHADAFKEYERALVDVFDDRITQISVADFNQTVHEVVNEYKGQVYSFTRKLTIELKRKGYFLLAISGSQQEIVKHIAQEYNFDDYAGSTYEQRDGRFTGKKHIIAADKVAALQMLVDRHSLSFTDSLAIGDTYSDIALLESVEKPIAFNPESLLYTKAKEMGWKIVIERKNVIYQLESHNGRYVLA